jgi:serine/threonine-protein kinase
MTLPADSASNKPREPRDQTTQPQTTTWLNNRYRLLAMIAGGGMATVYKAQDTLLNRVVAIKTLRDQFALDPQFMQRFREEAQAAANFIHPNVVTVFDVGKDKFQGVERQYLVMEYVDGHDLKHALRDRLAVNPKQIPFSVEEAIDFARQICEGVGYAHQRGLAHCDIKPQNVIITPSGKAKVTDFGISRAYTAMLSERSDMVWGTPQYFAPEQAMGHAPSPASDVYSIGVLLFEMLTGRLPFESRDPKELARMHIHLKPPEIHLLNPSVSLQLESIINKAMAKEPANRYRDANQLGRVLDAYLRQGEENTIGRTGVQSRQPSSKQPGNKPASDQPQYGNAQKSPLVTGSQVTPATDGSRSITGSTPAGMTGLTTVFKTSEGGPDLLVWLLSAIALACVLGLIPLYLAVYRTYADPPGELPAGSRAPVSTIVGSTQNGQNTPASPPTTSSGTAIPTQLIPADLTGRVLDEGLLATLKSVGWNVVTVNRSSFQTERVILGSEPAPGTRLAVNGTLTLTISTGGRMDIGADMTSIMLNSAKVNGDTFRPGQTVEVGLRWQAKTRVSTGYKTFVHILDLNSNTPRAQGDDREPRDNGAPAPTVTWSAGKVINDSFSIQLPNNIPAGKYRIQVGLYNDQGRLAVLNGGNATVRDNSILIKVIDVVR